ncbi:CDP-glycerol glycerophosphotransferase family protein [Cellulomonas sp. HZM]|uniref:CDP-glycerol glycerophosphotransferase family protein n=1 Tax=Cellulomonas sp. HZM TaxID=1454010 RepID=UPI001E60747B|nr:CDP-glycerol glycerophosphotransferase family protein [Cellulomonas sp. HZM]
MGLLGDVRRGSAKVGEVLTRRRLRREVAAIARSRPAVVAGTVEVVVYFADGAVNLYQVRQWFEPLRRLDEQHPVVVVTRSPDSARALFDECPVPVLHFSTIAELERWLGTHPVAAMLYVNQNRENFSTLRFTEPAHVFMSHGESDKSYMVSNQLKAYDHVLAAGPAAVRRIERNVYGLDPARILLVGRPQVDVTYAGPELPDDDRTVVLYAPTWEGDRPSMEYSSVLSHGPALLEALVADPRFRVVYRPHPRTGVQDGRFAAGDARLAGILARANESDPGAEHLVDRDTAFGWHLRAADVCVTDVSAVAFDWLATGRPLLLTRPESPTAVVEPGSLADRVDTIAAQDAGGAVAVVDALLARGADDAYAEVVADYFGDTRPGAAMSRFLVVADRVVRDRRAAQRERHGTRA